MDLSPYLIYYDHRPVRIAFLVDPKVGQGWPESIFEYNRSKWGGRFNPIILTDGKTISDEYWKFLRSYDPDVIHSTVDLSDELRKKIAIFLSPLQINTVTEKEHKYIRLNDDPVNILPTPKNISTISRGIMDDKVSIMLLDVDDQTPLNIRNFLERNFGILADNQSTAYHIKRQLQLCNKKTFAIRDFESLNTMLLELGDFQTRVVFPSQLCSLPNSFKDSTHHHQHERFTVVVGDSVEDLAYFWNRGIMIPQWMRTDFTQLWVPQEFFDNQQIRPGLEKFLNRYVGQTGNGNSHELHFTSTSLSEEIVGNISKKFDGAIWHPKTSGVITQSLVPDFSSSHGFFYRKRGLEFFQGHAREEHLSFSEPDVEEGGMGGQCWMIDLYVQFHPERFTSFIGSEYWWKLPRRNHLIADLHILNKLSRVNEHGMFSVLMQRRSDFEPDRNIVVLKLPEDRAVFDSLICGESFECISNDHRERFISRPFSDTRLSDKGRYLLGVTGLFPNLYSAQRLFEERYWRTIFGIMASQSDDKDKKVKQDLVNKLTKKITSGIDFKKNSKAIDWLADNVLHIARQHHKENVDLTLFEMSEKAQAETNEYNTSRQDHQIPFEEEDLKEEINDLLEKNVFLLGIKPKCPRCSYRIWYHIDEAKQEIECKGCGYVFSTDAEERWYYRLNSLVRAAVNRHGTVALLLALGQLLHDASSSFMYIPSTDLFKLYDPKNPESEYHFGEVDLLCIQDGKFVIGEVKQSMGLFGKEDFEKMKDIARLVRPDKIVFSSMAHEPSQFVLAEMQKVKSDLLDLEIDVEWLPLRYVSFDPSPI